MQRVKIKDIGIAAFPNNMEAQDIERILREQVVNDVIARKPIQLPENIDVATPDSSNLAQDAGQGISDFLTDSGIISNRYAAQNIGKNISAIGEFLPVVGDASAGDEFGRAVAKDDKTGMVLSALGVIPVIGDAAKSILKGADFNKAKIINTLGEKTNKLDDIDFDNPITHESSDADFSGVITDKSRAFGLFDGVFGLYGEEGAALGRGGNHVTYFPRKDKVAGSSDIDLDYDQSIKTIKREYPEATEEQVDRIYELSAEDSNIWDNPDDNPIADFGFDDTADASWEMQNLRGKIAVDQDFDAIEMSDENGISLLIPKGSKAITIKNIE